MGLAVAQVRLLALTNRKADIELRMQVNSKRKMMLTRRSTELAQQYYSKLKCANIQYATSAGYEDVNYNYIMGDTEAGSYKTDFIQGIAVASPSIVKKSQPNMILIDQMGRVVVNDGLAKIIAIAKDNSPTMLKPDGTPYLSANKTSARTCNAILSLVEEYKDKPVITGDHTSGNTSGAAALTFKYYRNADGSINETKKSQLMYYMQLMMDHDGYKDEGQIYKKGGKYYYSLNEATSGTGAPLTPQVGHMYTIYNMDSSPSTSLEAMYTGTGSDGFDYTLSKSQAKYLANLIDYFAPIISAAIQNGLSTEVTRTARSGNVNVTESDPSKIYVPSDSEADVKAKILSAVGSFTDGKTYCLSDEFGNPYYFTAKNINPGGTPNWQLKNAKSTDFYDYEVTDNAKFQSVQNTEKLQDNFRSGVYQLAMVADPSRGIYHKNTTMNYFTHMNYVIERTDTSRKEEITAWFNTEQAAINEQETYWDTEIQNLSTELSSVNTEISAVKQLKSDNIKSVFNWGGN